MTANEFVKRIIAAYGNYTNPGMLDAVSGWCKRHDHADFASLYDTILTTFPSQYGKQPDVFVLEKALKSEDNAAWYRGKRIGHYDGDTFIPDLRELSTEQIQEYRASFAELSYPASFGKWLAEQQGLALPAPEGPEPLPTPEGTKLLKDIRHRFAEKIAE